jgi:hypothetical protein
MIERKDLQQEYEADGSPLEIAFLSVILQPLTAKYLIGR